jgi:ParB family transcriptional regulator, chromosome partitioning protein
MSKVTKPRLGRGLSSLISVSDGPDELVAAPSMLEGEPVERPPAVVASELPLTQRIIQIPVGEVKSNPHQPRRDFQDSSLQELAASLKTNGLIQPIVVRQSGVGYELIAGERRLRAARLAGLPSLPAIVKEVDGLTQAQLALVENIQREDLNAIDRAQAYKSLIEQLGLSHAELANRLGEDRSTISNHLRLLELAVPVRELIRSGELTLGHAKVLAGVADVLEQERLAKLVASQALSVRNLERLVQSGTGPANKSKVSPSAHIKNLEKSIARQLGMRVNVRSKANGTGKLIIHYSSLDQFDELMAKLAVQASEED